MIVEPENTEDGRLCKRYLQKLDYNYSGVLSFLVLSELFVIMQSFDDFNDRYDFLEPLLAMIKVRCIKFYAPKDREILACASEDKAYALVTLDKDMTNNKNLEKLLKIKILHPKDLL